MILLSHFEYAVCHLPRSPLRESGEHGLGCNNLNLPSPLQTARNRLKMVKTIGETVGVTAPEKRWDANAFEPCFQPWKRIHSVFRRRSDGRQGPAYWPCAPRGGASQFSVGRGIALRHLTVKYTAQRPASANARRAPRRAI